MEWLSANIVPIVVALGTLAGSFGAIKVALAKIETRLSAAESAINSRSTLTETIAVHATRLEHIDEKINDIGEDYNTLTISMNHIAEGVSELNTRATISEIATDRLVSTLEKLDTTLSRINDTVISLETRVNHLEEAKN